MVPRSFASSHVCGVEAGLFILLIKKIRRIGMKQELSQILDEASAEIKAGGAVDIRARV